MLEDHHQQNRLEDWNEFRAFYYRRLKAHKKRIEPAEKELLLRQKIQEEAQARLTDIIDDRRVLNAQVGEIVASRREIALANSRVESAEKGLAAAKRNKSKRRAALIKMAQQELRSARDNLKHASGSEEMRRLRDGSELECTEHAVIGATAGLGAVQLEVKRWEVFLGWFDDQYPAIAAECGCPTQDGVKDVPLEFLWGQDGPKRQKLPHQRNRTQKRAVLGPNSSSRIAKPSKDKSDCRPQPTFSNTLLTVTTTPTTPQRHPAESQNPPRRSKRVQQSKADQVARVPEISVLRPVYSSRVTKAQATLHATNRPPTHSEYSALKRTARTKWNTTGVNNNLRRSQRIMARNLEGSVKESLMERSKVGWDKCPT